MKINILTITLGLIATGSIFAEYPNNSNAEKMTKCITIECSGANYQSWKKELDKAEVTTDLVSMQSPIAGLDIFNLKPVSSLYNHSKKQEKTYKTLFYSILSISKSRNQEG